MTFSGEIKDRWLSYLTLLERGGCEGDGSHLTDKGSVCLPLLPCLAPAALPTHK